MSISNIPPRNPQDVSPSMDAQPQDASWLDVSNMMSWVSSTAGTAVKGLAGFVTTLAPVVVPEEQLELERQKLVGLTGSTVAQETAKVMAKRQIHKFTYLLTHLDQLQPRDIEGSLKKFVHMSDQGVSLTVKGQLFLFALGVHRDLLERVFEVNIMRAMFHAVSYVRDLQQNQPLFLVELVQEALQEIASELKEPSLVQEGGEDAEHDVFMRKLQQKIIKALFPNGAEDIDIPLPLQKVIGLNRHAFLQLQEMSLPRKMGVVYDRATSEVTKYKLLARVVDEVKKFLADIPEEQESPTVSSVLSSEQQEVFNKQLKEALYHFLGSIDSKLIKLFRPILAKQIAARGHTIVNKLVNIDLMKVFNESMQNACLRLSPGGQWHEEDGNKRFSFVACDPLTFSQRQQYEQEELARNKAHVQESIEHIAKDLNGLITRAANTKSSNSLGADDSGRFVKIKQELGLVFVKVRKSCVKAVVKVFGVDRFIKKLSKTLLAQAEALDLEKAAQPIKRVVSRSRGGIFRSL